MRQRVSGPLDSLLDEMPKGRVSELAKVLGCSRKSIFRWQKGIQPSAWSRMRVNAVAVAYGLRPPFEERQGWLPFDNDDS